MPTPYSTIVSNVTVYNNSSIPVTNASTVNVVVTYPDASQANFSLTNNVVYLGSGAYSLTYNTKGVGRTTEEWSVYVLNSTPQATFRDAYQVAEGTS